MTPTTKRALIIFVLSVSATMAYMMFVHKPEQIAPPKPKEEGDNGNKMAQVVKSIQNETIKA